MRWIMEFMSIYAATIKEIPTAKISGIIKSHLATPKGRD
jgi:hypothetical protein